MKNVSFCQSWCSPAAGTGIAAAGNNQLIDWLKFVFLLFQSWFCLAAGNGKDAEEFTIKFVYYLSELVLSGCWNWDGSEVLFTCKDKTIRRVDPRLGSLKELL